MDVTLGFKLLQFGDASSAQHPPVESKSGSSIGTLDKFPPEVRDMIWEDLVITDCRLVPYAEWIAQRDHKAVPYRNFLAISQTSRQAHQETSDLHYRRNRFYFHTSSRLRTFLIHLQPQYLLTLRRLYIHWEDSSRKFHFMMIPKCVNLEMLAILVGRDAMKYNTTYKRFSLEGAPITEVLKKLRVNKPELFILRVHGCKKKVGKIVWPDSEPPRRVPESQLAWMKEFLYGEITGAAARERAAEKAERRKFMRFCAKEKEIRIQEWHRGLAAEEKAREKAQGKAEKARFREEECRLAAEQKAEAKEVEKAEKAKVREDKRKLAAVLKAQQKAANTEKRGVGKAN